MRGPVGWSGSWFLRHPESCHPALFPAHVTRPLGLSGERPPRASSAGAQAFGAAKSTAGVSVPRTPSLLLPAAAAASGGEPGPAPARGAHGGSQTLAAAPRPPSCGVRPTGFCTLPKLGLSEQIEVTP